MKRRFLFSSLAILIPFLINGMVNSADLWPMKIGQKFIYKRTDSANPPNSWNNEMEVIKKENVCSDEYFKVKISNYSIGETGYTHFRSTDNAVFVCDADADTVCVVAACGPKGTTLNCGDEVIEIMESKEISVPFGGPFTACVNRKHNEDEPDIPYWFQYLYVVPGVGMVKEIDWWNDNPPTVSELTRVCYDGAADFTSDKVSGSAPLAVNFTDQSCGIITSWSWDFGDGSTSSEQNPSHTYTNPGTYIVSLTVTGPGGFDKKTEVDFISVSQWTRKSMPFIPLLLDD